MSDGTLISWTDASWPVVTGCTHLSDGCDNCYAAKLTSGRLKHLPEYAGLAEHGRFNGTVRLLPDRLDWPLHWRKPRKVFVSDMSDLFHQDVPGEFIAKVWAVMALCPQHTFQVLTKRHARMRYLLGSSSFPAAVRDVIDYLIFEAPAHRQRLLYHQAYGGGESRFTWPLANVWVGVSVEDRHWATIRIPALLKTPAAVRFLSCEPLLGPIDLHAQDDGLHHWLPDYGPSYDDGSGEPVCQAHGISDCERRQPHAGCAFVHWVIAGGESGPGHRPMNMAWLETIAEQCLHAGIPLWVKQDSGPRAGQQGRIPDRLWIQEFPLTREAVAALWSSRLTRPSPSGAAKPAGSSCRIPARPSSPSPKGEGL